MGPQEDYIETVFTCEGDINDPNLQSQLEDFRKGLRDLLSTDKRKLILKKVEPWNSVRVTFNIPREAACRLKQLAQQGDSTLRQLGVLAVQIEGDQIISLTIAGRNNERTRLVFRTESDTVDAPSVSVIDPGGSGTNEAPAPSNAESATQKNIADYLRQGAPLFDSLFGQQSSASDAFRTGADAIPFASMGMPSSSGRSPPQGQQPFGFPPGKPAGVPPHQGVFFPSDQQAKGTMVQPGMKLPSPPGLSHSIPPQQGHEHLLPPPPPYPHGSALVNSFVKGGRYGTSSTGSPLLVNLLQTEPSLAGINNFMHSKMLPPPETGSPPKKKRRQRKPKEKTTTTVSETRPESPSTSMSVPLSEGEISIHSVPNPALATCGLPLVTSGSSSNMPSIPMVTQALPASTPPAVTFSGRPPIHPPHLPSHTDTNLYTVTSTAASKLNPLSQEVIPRKSDLSDISLPENTDGKIINPYTGLLEPMENVSDTSPIKSENSLDGFSPHKKPMKRPPKDKKPSPSGIYPVKNVTFNNAMHPGRMSSSDRISVPSSSAGHPSVNYTRQQHQQNETMSVYSTSNLMLPSSLSSSSTSSSPLPLTSAVSRSNSAFVQSSPGRQETVASMHNSTQSRPGNRGPVGPDYMSVSSASQGFVSRLPTSASPRTLPGFMHSVAKIPSLEPLHQSVYRSLTSGFPEDNHMTTACCAARTTTSNTPIMSHRQQQHAPPIAVASLTHQKISSENASSTNSEQLLNPHVMNHPAKNTSVVVSSSTNCLIDSPGGDSENSSQSSLLHDHSTHNDIAASGCSLEQETRVYNHDSGIGSSSERSDGTPSEPGDDFKAAHANSEDCGAAIKHFLDGINKTTCVPKSDAQVITVGYAMSDSRISKNTMKHHSDISSILSMPMEKALMNHQTFNHVNCRKDRTKVVNHHVDPSHVTALHWSTKDKIFSNKVESNKRKSPKQFLRDECMAQVMSNKQKLPPYTTDHLQQKVDPTQHGNCVSTFGGADGHSTVSAFSHGVTSMACKVDEPRRPSFSSPQDVSRSAVASHQLNSHLANRCTSPHSCMMSDENYVMCNNDLAGVQSVPNTPGSWAGPPPGTNAVTFSSSDQPNSSHYYNPQKSFSRNLHGDRKAKSPVANNPMSLATNINSCHQTDSVVSSTSVSGFSQPTSDGMYSLGYTTCNSEVMTNGPVLSTKADPVRSVVSSSSSYDAQKHPISTQATVTSGYNKRRSPANSMINSLPQNFFDPALPLAKRLTESVQKLVKPLPSSDQSSLPPHKSPVCTTSSKSVVSNSPPRLTRNSLDKSEAVLMVGKSSPKDIDSSFPPNLSAEILSVLPCQTHGQTDNQEPSSSQHKSIMHTMASQEFGVSSYTGSLTNQNIPFCDSNFPVLSSTNSDYTSEHPSLEMVNNIGDYLSCGTSTKKESMPDTLTNSASEAFLHTNSSSETFLHTHSASPSKGSYTQQSYEHASVYSGEPAAGAVTPANPDAEMMHNPEYDVVTYQTTSRVTINCNGNKCNTSSSKNCSPNSLLNCGASNNGLTSSQMSAIPSSQAECVDSGGLASENGQKQCYTDSSHSDTKENCEGMHGNPMSTHNSVPSGGHISDQNQDHDVESHVIGNPVGIPRLTPVDSEQINSTDDILDTSAPAMSTRLQRQASIQESPDDSSTSTMALRTRKSSESNENKPNEIRPNENSAQHSLRLTRHRVSPVESTEKEPATRQRSNTTESQDKNAGTESDASKNLRTSSRRKKPTQNDMETGGTEPNRKSTSLEDSEVAKHTRSSDVKDLSHSLLKNDMLRMSAGDVVDGVVPDSLKTGLRNRTQNKAGDEKAKVLNKDPKKKPVVLDDDLTQNRKAQLSRRSRHSPTLPQLQNQGRDRSPIRGSRTRTLVPPNTDSQEDKRSTRSSKPRDATETLPPSNKRRRSSRDHR